MFIISLILGILLGGASVVFILQNITPITVSFFSWQIEGSLAVLLFLALACGMIITGLLLLPSFARDEIRLARLRRENKRLSEEVATSTTGVVFTDGAVDTLDAPVVTVEEVKL